MESEYSVNDRQGYAYTFAAWEKRHIAAGLKPIIKKLQKQRSKIESDPENEGQATFQCQIDDLEREISVLTDIISEFSSLSRQRRSVS